MTRSKRVDYKDILLTAEENAIEDTKLPTAEAIRQTEINQARDSGSTTLLELVSPYGHEERDTWPTQQKEAREWLVDNNAPCTMIRRIAYHREIKMAVMVAKIMENVTLFEYVAGDILGVQQKQIDDLG